jgi:hypothetical protein
MEPLYFKFPSLSYRGNHDWSSTEPHQHPAPVDQFQPIPHSTYSENYGAAGYPDVSPLTAMPAPSITLPAIAHHQTWSDDLMPQDATAHSGLCEVSTH